MNNKQKEKLWELFREQQRFNLATFRDELKYMDYNMDYKAEKLRLELSIHETKQNLKFMAEQFRSCLNKTEKTSK